VILELVKQRLWRDLLNVLFVEIFPKISIVGENDVVKERSSGKVLSHSTIQVANFLKKCKSGRSMKKRRELAKGHRS